MRTRALLALLLASCAPPVVDADDGGRCCSAVADGGATDAGPRDASLADAGVADAGAQPAGDAGGEPAPASLALVVKSGHFETADGGVVDVRGAISCCGGGEGWPLFDEAWVNRVAAASGNFLHMRLGPFRTEGNGETDWAPVGGGYVEQNAKADLTQFNEVFWARVRALLQFARAKGLFVEVDVIDGWAIKHCRAGDLPGYSAWDPAFNAQAQDGCGATGGGPVVAGDLQDRWIRKVVAETGRFDHVLYQDSNEAGLIPGYGAAWTKSIHDVIRDEEQKRGYGRHLFGTNSEDSTAMQLSEVDYLEFHQNQPRLAGQCFGKPCMVNEYNPSPPLTPAQFQQRFCEARRQGTAFWYWRHDQTAAQLSASLALLGAPCP